MSFSKLGCTTVIAITMVFSSIAGDRWATTGARNSAPGIQVAEIRNYRQMTRVNKVPIDMIEETRTLCGRQPLWQPHYSPGLVYYINETTRQGLATFQEKKQFPVGSIIVKEKQEKRTEDSVKIITVMKKINAGSSIDSWDFKMYDVSTWKEMTTPKQISLKTSEREADCEGCPKPAGEVKAATKKPVVLTESCTGCHRQYDKNDYISPRGIELLFAK